MGKYWEGELIRLRATEPGDAEAHYILNQDMHTSRMLDMVYPPSSMARMIKWADEATQKGFDNDEFSFQMESIESGQLVGHIATHFAQRRVGVFSYGINVYTDQQGKGYASEAVRLVLRYYFDELRYQKCNVQVNAINPESIRLHERLGFVGEGRLRRVVFTEGEFSDQLLYGITAEEFRERYPDMTGSA